MLESGGSINPSAVLTHRAEGVEGLHADVADAHAQPAAARKNATVLADRLAARDLAPRQRSPDGGRATILQLTATSAQLAQRAHQASSTTESGRLHALTPGERVLPGGLRHEPAAAA